MKRKKEIVEMANRIKKMVGLEYRDGRYRTKNNYRYGQYLILQWVLGNSTIDLKGGKKK